MNRREILRGAAEGMLLAFAGYEVYAAEGASQNKEKLDVINSPNSANLSFVPAGAGGIVTSVQDKLRELVSVRDFGANPTADGITNANAFQASLDYAHSIAGALVMVPQGTYRLNSSLRIYGNTTLRGDGWGVSTLSFTHNGDGINSSWPINSSSSANINIQNLSIVNSNSLNSGSGFVDVGGTYIDIANCYFQGWKYGIILDQSELVVIDRNNFSGMVCQLWLVNGAGHSTGAKQNFTNRITISSNQFNGGLNQIQDDGGTQRLIKGNNFNGGANQIRSAGSSLLTIINNEFESATKTPIYFADKTESGLLVGGPVGFSIQNNGIGVKGGLHNIYIDEAYCGDISSNIFYWSRICAIEFNYGLNYKIGNISISGNMVGNYGGTITSSPFVTSEHYDIWRRQGGWKQGATTYCTSSASAGYQQITPASMVGIYDGANLRLVNVDGSNAETVSVVINSAAPSTFFATLKFSKSENFRIFVEEGDCSGTYTPLVTGSGPVGNAVVAASAAYGSYNKVGNRCFFQANVTWSALKGGAAGQLQLTLPLACKADAACLSVIACTVIGSMAIGTGANFLSPVSGKNIATLVYVNQTTGKFSGNSLSTSGSIYVSGSYEI